MDSTRRQFIVTIAAIGGGVGLFGSGCDGSPAPDDAGSPPDSGGGGCAAPQSTIADNHGHSLTVSASDVTTGTMQTYDIIGTGTHAHTVTLEAAHFATLAGGGPVTVTSSVGGSHTHEVTVSCS